MEGSSKTIQRRRKRQERIGESGSDELASVCGDVATFVITVMVLRNIEEGYAAQVYLWMVM